MGFSSGYWHYFHYSDCRDNLIFCCHGAASKLRMIYTLQTDYIIQWILRQSILITAHHHSQDILGVGCHFVHALTSFRKGLAAPALQ